MHGSISHAVNAQNLSNNIRTNRIEFEVGRMKEGMGAVNRQMNLFLPSGEMAAALATIHTSTLNTFPIIFTRIWITSFNLIISRCKFILVIEI